MRERAVEVIASDESASYNNEVVKTHGLQLVGLDYMNADENAFDMRVMNKLTIKEELPKIPIINGKPFI